MSELGFTEEGNLPKFTGKTEKKAKSLSPQQVTHNAEWSEPFDFPTGMSGFSV